MTDGSGPIAGATVTATPSGRTGRAGDSTTTTDASGHYQFLDAAGRRLRRDRVEVRLPVRRRRAASPSRPAGTPCRTSCCRPAPTVVVNGVVKDGSGQGWPLYAKIVVSGSAGLSGRDALHRSGHGLLLDHPDRPAPPMHFAVTAVAPGYVPGGGPLSLPAGPSANAPTALVANWSLVGRADLHRAGIRAGQLRRTARPLRRLRRGNHSRRAGPSTRSRARAGRSRRAATPAASSTETGRAARARTRSCNSGCFSVVTTDDSSLVTPADGSLRSIERGDPVGQRLRRLRLRHRCARRRREHRRRRDLDERLDSAAARPAGPGQSDRGHVVRGRGMPNVQARFHYQGFWAWWWQVDDVEVGDLRLHAAARAASSSATVSDANTGAGLNGATVRNAAERRPRRRRSRRRRTRRRATASTSSSRRAARSPSRPRSPRTIRRRRARRSSRTARCASTSRSRPACSTPARGPCRSP